MDWKETTLGGIFISYRREDSRLTCDRIYDTLGAIYGNQFVFRDVDTIPGGVDFRAAIDESLGRTRVFLLLIGPHWLTTTDLQGKRRLDSPDDFVRLEIEGALRHGMPIIPLLVQGAQPPSSQDLPASLAPITYQNARYVRPDPDFHRDMQLVLRDLAAYFAPAARKSGWRRLRYDIGQGTRWAITIISLVLTMLALATWIHIPLLSDLVNRLLGGR
jgi:hypothetical protein